MISSLGEIFERHNIETCAVAGHSFGSIVAGYVGLQWNELKTLDSSLHLLTANVIIECTCSWAAASFPERVQLLILIDPVCLLLWYVHACSQAGSYLTFLTSHSTNQQYTFCTQQPPRRGRQLPLPPPEHQPPEALGQGPDRPLLRDHGRARPAPAFLVVSDGECDGGCIRPVR